MPTFAISRRRHADNFPKLARKKRDIVIAQFSRDGFERQIAFAQQRARLPDAAFQNISVQSHARRRAKLAAQRADRHALGARQAFVIGHEIGIALQLLQHGFEPGFARLFLRARFDRPGINLWAALTDMTPENGCLQVVPRSHLEGTIDSVQNPDGDSHRTVAKDPTRFLPVRMRAGDVIAFTRLTLHGSGPNITDEPRVAYAAQFHRDDVNWQREGQWILLKDVPRWNDINPRAAFENQADKARDGH